MGPELKAAAGTSLGRSAERTISQEMVQRFADLTGDRQWIHVDVERAARGPYGAPLAHGYLTMSLVPELLRGLFKITGAASGVNYGTDRLRFPAPVRVGRRVWLEAELKSVGDVPGGQQIAVACAMRVEDEAKPGVAGDFIFRYFYDDDSSQD
jgi:acyl dehydratase